MQVDTSPVGLEGCRKVEKHVVVLMETIAEKLLFGFTKLLKQRKVARLVGREGRK